MFTVPAHPVPDLATSGDYDERELADAVDRSSSGTSSSTGASTPMATVGFALSRRDVDGGPRRPDVHDARARRHASTDTTLHYVELAALVKAGHGQPFPAELLESGP